MTSQTEDSITDREISISRRYDAPPSLVWRALTNAEHVGHWWGPDGFTLTTAEMDVRVGGVWRYTMHGPDGTDYPNLIEYHTVREPALLGFRHSDDGGEIAFEATITLAAVDGGTELTLRQVHPTKEARDTAVREYGAIEGGKQTLARLAEYLTNME